jgi:hypothetical protein
MMKAQWRVLLFSLLAALAGGCGDDSSPTPADASSGVVDAGSEDSGTECAGCTYGSDPVECHPYGETWMPNGTTTCNCSEAGLSCSGIIMP